METLRCRTNKALVTTYDTEGNKLDEALETHGTVVAVKRDGFKYFVAISKEGQDSPPTLKEFDSRSAAVEYSEKVHRCFADYNRVSCPDYNHVSCLSGNLSSRVICPFPEKWNEIHQALCERRAAVGHGTIPEPPLPLIETWAKSTDAQKSKRWQKTIEWLTVHRKKIGLGCLPNTFLSDCHMKFPQFTPQKSVTVGVKELVYLAYRYLVVAAVV
jgi:hypothetical protein